MIGSTTSPEKHIPQVGRARAKTLRSGSKANKTVHRRYCVGGVPATREPFSPLPVRRIMNPWPSTDAASISRDDSFRSPHL